MVSTIASPRRRRYLPIKFNGALQGSAAWALIGKLLRQLFDMRHCNGGFCASQLVLRGLATMSSLWPNESPAGGQSTRRRSSPARGAQQAEDSTAVDEQQAADGDDDGLASGSSVVMACVFQASRLGAAYYDPCTGAVRRAEGGCFSLRFAGYTPLLLRHGRCS